MSTTSRSYANIFQRLQDKPTYHPGLYACIACCLFTLIIVCLISFRSWTLNKRADRGELELEYYDVSFAQSFRSTFTY